MESAAGLLREARTKANLSIRALATKAGVAASTIGRIEQGRLEPTFSTLSRLLAVTGQELRAHRAPTLSRQSPPRLADLSRAWRGTPDRGEPDWTALRGTLDVLLQHPQSIPAAIADPPRRPRSGVQRALLAGIAEQLAAGVGEPSPAWARRTGPLAREWAPPGTPRMRQAWRDAAPAELRARNVVVDEASLWRTHAPREGELATA